MSDLVFLMSFNAVEQKYHPERWFVFDVSEYKKEGLKPIATIFQDENSGFWLIEDDFHDCSFYKPCYTREHAETVLQETYKKEGILC